MATPQSPVQAPDFTLDHVLGHSITLSSFRGRPVAVLFAGRESSAHLRAAITTIRRSYSPDHVVVLGVIDLRGAPRPARIVIRRKLKEGYEEAVAEARAAGLPGDIQMLVDWNGQAIDAYGVQVEQQAMGVLIDAQGWIRGWGAGEQMGAQILGLLAAG